MLWYIMLALGVFFLLNDTVGDMINKNDTFTIVMLKIAQQTRWPSTRVQIRPPGWHSNDHDLLQNCAIVARQRRNLVQGSGRATWRSSVARPGYGGPAAAVPWHQATGAACPGANDADMARPGANGAAPPT